MINITEIKTILVDGELISSIKNGLCVLVGIGRDDTKKDIDYLLVHFQMLNFKTLYPVTVQLCTLHICVLYLHLHNL